MTKLDEYRGQFLNSSLPDQGSFSERMALKRAIQDSLLPKFEEGVFRTVAAKYHKTDGVGLTAHFGKISLSADTGGGHFVVTLQRGESIISFGSVTEDPSNHFRNPSLMSYLGKPEEWRLMIDQVAQGLKRAEKRGSKPLIEIPVLAKTLGG